MLPRYSSLGSAQALVRFQIKEFAIRKFLSILRLFLPWIIASGLLYYLFHKIPPQDFLQGLKRVQLGPFLAFAVFYFVYVMLWDTWGLARVMSLFATPITLRELLPGRCVSYLLSIINYNAGQAVLGLYVKKTHGGSLFKSLGAVMFVSIIDLYWVIFLALVGSFFLPHSLENFDISPWIQRVAYVAWMGLFLHLAFWRGWLGRVVPKKFHLSFGDWLRGRHLFQAFHHAKVSDYLRIAFWRLPLHAMFIFSLWMLIRLFGAQLPPLEALVTVPVIFLFGALPITPGGLGAVQMATVELLKNQIVLSPSLAGQVEPKDLLFALSLTWMGINYIFKALSGLYYWWTRPRTLFQQSPDNDATRS